MNFNDVEKRKLITRRLKLIYVVAYDLECFHVADFCCESEFFWIKKKDWKYDQHRFRKVNKLLTHFNIRLVQNLGHTNAFLQLWAQLF